MSDRKIVRYVVFFFLNYRKCTINYRKYTKQPVCINNFEGLPKQIACYLNLEYPNLYTGHCFHRSSTTISADAGGDKTALKIHEGWRSTSVADGDID